MLGSELTIGPVVLRWCANSSSIAMGSVRHRTAPTEPNPPSRADSSWLGPIDRRRVAAFRPARRDEFLLGRAMLHQILTDWFGGPEVDTRPCPNCGGPHGGVEVDPPTAQASISYTAQSVVVAVAGTEVTQLGVDVVSTAADPVRDADLARLLGVPAAAALQRWAAVEAVLKATGQGLRIDPDRVSFAGAQAWVETTRQAFRLATVPLPDQQLVVLAWGPPQ